MSVRNARRVLDALTEAGPAGLPKADLMAVTELSAGQLKRALATARENGREMLQPGQGLLYVRERGVYTIFPTLADQWRSMTAVARSLRTSDRRLRPLYRLIPGLDASSESRTTNAIGELCSYLEARDPEATSEDEYLEARALFGQVLAMISTDAGDRRSAGTVMPTNAGEGDERWHG